MLRLTVPMTEGLLRVREAGERSENCVTYDNDKTWSLPGMHLFGAGVAAFVPYGWMVYSVKCSCCK